MNSSNEFSSNEQNPTPKHEAIQDDSDFIADPIASLLEQLDFWATPELTEAAEAVLAGLLEDQIDDPRMQAAWAEYAMIIEHIVEESTKNPSEYVKSQIAAIVHKGLIFCAAGNTMRYLEELDAAEVYAFNAGLDEVSETLQDELDLTIEALKLSLSPETLLIKLKYIISEDNREHLRDLMNEGNDLNDMIGNVYAMILEEGGDPDEVLTNLGVLNQE